MPCLNVKHLRHTYVGAKMEDWKLIHRPKGWFLKTFVVSKLIVIDDRAELNTD